MNIDISHLTSLFEHATEGIILTNGQGNIVLMNPAARRLFGYEPDELFGHPIEVLLPQRIQPHHIQLRKGFYHHPQNRVMGQGRDLYGKHKNGLEIPVEVSLSFYERDKELFVIAFVVDITRRKEIENDVLQQQKQLEKMAEDMRKLNLDLETKVEQRTLILREALQELEKSQTELNEALSKEKELNEIKSRFVSMASHEFRTPLSTVLSSAALVSKYTRSEDQDKRDRHIRRIRDSVKHLNDLLEDFLSLGKLEEGRITAHPEAFGVKEFLEEIAEEMRTIAKPGQDIQIHCEAAGTFFTDKKLLKNILINLIGNACKFSEENSPIYISALHSGNALTISVKDNGMGISEEDLQHLFSSFFRGKNAVNIQGTGLGLHIVRRYMDLLRGSIGLESKLGAGTTVTLELPDLAEEN